MPVRRVVAVQRCAAAAQQYVVAVQNYAVVEPELHVVAAQD